MKPTGRPPSLPRLVARFFTPLALGDTLEPVPPGADPTTAAAVRYRNTRALFEASDRYITRSAGVVLACFFAYPVVGALGAPAILMALWAVLLLGGAVHAAALGVYRQVLRQRLERLAAEVHEPGPPPPDPPAKFPPPGE